MLGNSRFKFVHTKSVHHPKLETGSIDLCLTDPPYGMTACKWDSVIPLQPMWEQLNRVVRGAVLLFGLPPFSSAVVMSNVRGFKYEWVWEKTQATGFLNASKAPLRAHENVLVFYRKLPTFNPIKTNGHKPINSYTKRAVVQNRTEVYGKVKSDVSGGGETDRFPRDVIKFSSDKQRTKLDGTIHPTQKPVELLRYLIRTYSNEGETVLDFTCGSGSTGVAAKLEGRKFIGIDNDAKYVEIARQRLVAC